jgi:hypothetical protein
LANGFDLARQCSSVRRLPPVLRTSPVNDRRRNVREPEFRALEQIVADADRAGRQVVVLGPAGILEVTPDPSE